MKMRSLRSWRFKNLSQIGHLTPNSVPTLTMHQSTMSKFFTIHLPFPKKLTPRVRRASWLLMFRVYWTKMMLKNRCLFPSQMILIVFNQKIKSSMRSRSRKKLWARLKCLRQYPKLKCLRLNLKWMTTKLQTAHPWKHLRNQLWANGSHLRWILCRRFSLDKFLKVTSTETQRFLITLNRNLPPKLLIRPNQLQFRTIRSKVQTMMRTLLKLL